MTAYLPLIAAALIGVLVPACSRWLWQKIEAPLGRIDERMTQLEAGHAAHETRLNAQEVEIAFLRGVQSERQQVATAAAAMTQIAAAAPFGEHKT